MPNGVSKWQKKSVEVNQIRWDLERILTEDIAHDEQNLEKYKELVEAAYAAVDHSVPENLVRARNEKQPRWHRIMWVSIIGSTGGIVTELIQYIPNFWAFVHRFLGGH